MLLFSAACGDKTNPEVKTPQEVPQEQNWGAPLPIKGLGSICQLTKEDLENSEQLKLIIKTDSGNKVFILKKSTQKWAILSPKSAKGLSGNDLLSLIAKLTSESRDCSKFVKNKDRSFDHVFRKDSGSFGEDRGIKQESFEEYVKNTSQYHSILFPNGYTKQLDSNGDFIVD